MVQNVTLEDGWMIFANLECVCRLGVLQTQLKCRVHVNNEQESRAEFTSNRSDYQNGPRGKGYSPEFLQPFVDLV